jgi:alkylation response protein AidB-like acyl-CoA dehydrogenase
MTIAISEAHRELADAARAVLARQGGTGPAREANEKGTDQLPAGWNELVAMSWPGLAVAEEWGGSGYGFAELAVLLYEAGRVAAPGPLLPSAWASAVLSRAAGASSETTDLAGHLLPGLASGDRVGAVGWREVIVGGAWADVLLVIEGEDVLVFDAGGDLRLVPGDSVDRARPAVRLEGGSALGRLPGAAHMALSLGRVVASAEAAGCAAGALEAATAYAKVRQQFGRPIGSFQAVKHHLANMLVQTELATAAAWDAAQAADGDPVHPSFEAQLRIAAATAAVEAIRGAVTVTKTSIQVHGGIGFTWEHDAHLLLRRATTLRALLAVTPDPATELTELTRSGARRVEAVDLPPEAAALRDEVTRFRARLLALPEGDRRAELTRSGYLMPHWPAPWGRGAGAVEQLVIDEVLADVDRPDLGISGWVTLTIAQHGTPDQLDRWIAASLGGEIVFCQMFSEPDAGSDAAAIKTRATRVEGGWLVNGQKVWTSNAHFADLGFATVRTDPSAPKHRGVTMMVVDLTAPGVEIRPLRQITGESHFNEIFLTDVFVPDDDVVGAVGDGWAVARATLGNERVSIGGGRPFATPATDLAQDCPPAFVAELGALIAQAGAQRALQRRMVVRAVVGAGPGAEGNVTKLASGELAQRTSDLAVRIAGPAIAGRADGTPTRDYLNTLCLTIAGGTSEIVRNQIAERLLGLPREPLVS